MRDFTRRLYAAFTNRGPGYDPPARSETDLRAALADLADRWDRYADRLAEGVPTEFYADLTEPQLLEAAHMHAFRNAASDLREVERTGRPPHALMTDAELEQYGAPEEATS